LLTAIESGVPIVGVSIKSGQAPYDFAMAVEWMTHLDTLLGDDKKAQLDALGIRKSYTLTKEDCRSSISVILMKGTLYVKHIQTFGNPDVEMALEEEELTRNKFNCVEFGFKADPEKAWGIAKRLANWECGD